MSALIRFECDACLEESRCRRRRPEDHFVDVEVDSVTETWGDVISVVVDGGWSVMSMGDGLWSCLCPRHVEMAESEAA